jgi:hypothetical protein
MSSQGHVLEHGSSRGSRWLRAQRLRIAVVIAAVEGLLVVFDVIPWWLALVVAAAAIVVYLTAGREARSDSVRQTSWIAAASQALVVLVPVGVVLLTSLAVAVVVILAVIALILLLTDRR